MLKKTILVAAAVMFMAGSAYAEELYVKSRSARITAEQGLGGTVVATASRGDTLTVVSRDGRWIKVEHQGKQGWIPALLLSSRPILSRETATYADRDAPKARVRASSYQTAAAARGLSEENRERLDQFGTGNFEGLETLETFRPSESELESFLEEEGK